MIPEGNDPQKYSLILCNDKTAAQREQGIQQLFH